MNRKDFYNLITLLAALAAVGSFLLAFKNYLHK